MDDTHQQQQQPGEDCISQHSCICNWAQLFGIAGLSHAHTLRQATSQLTVFIGESECVLVPTQLPSYNFDQHFVGFGTVPNTPERIIRWGNVPAWLLCQLHTCTLSHAACTHHWQGCCASPVLWHASFGSGAQHTQCVLGSSLIIAARCMGLDMLPFAYGLTT